MKRLPKFAAAAAIILCSSYASAIQWTDVDLDGNGDAEFEWLIAYGSVSDSIFEADFNLLDDGFDPIAMQIEWAYVEFAFADDERKRNGRPKDPHYEEVDISVGGSLIFDNLEVDGSHRHGYARYGTYLDFNQLFDLQDGIIAYDVEMVLGDSWLKEASITAGGGPRISIPDAGATLGLLGLGIACLAVLKRSMDKPKA